MPELAALIATASLGAMLFFSAFIAPTVFRALPKEHAGNFLRALFPKYFVVNGIAAVMAGLIAADVIISPVLVAAGVAMLAIHYFAIPIINDARDQMMAGVTGADKKFALWHRVSVIINVIEMVFLAMAIYILLAR